MDIESVPWARHIEDYLARYGITAVGSQTARPSDKVISPQAPDVPASRSREFSPAALPDVLWPIQGCNILVNWDTNQPYAMPIRVLDPASEQAVTDRDDPRAWYKYASENKSLSYEQKIACIQRAVILDPSNPGWWYTLGCHYELKGKDWYGAANAFNHVVFLQPKHAVAWYSLARLWEIRGIMSKAREAYARFQELQKGDCPG